MYISDGNYDKALLAQTNNAKAPTDQRQSRHVQFYDADLLKEREHGGEPAPHSESSETAEGVRQSQKDEGAPVPRSRTDPMEGVQQEKYTRSSDSSLPKRHRYRTRNGIIAIVIVVIIILGAVIGGAVGGTRKKSTGSSSSNVNDQPPSVIQTAPIASDSSGNTAGMSVGRSGSGVVTSGPRSSQ